MFIGGESVRCAHKCGCGGLGCPPFPRGGPVLLPGAVPPDLQTAADDGAVREVLSVRHLLQEREEHAREAARVCTGEFIFILFIIIIIFFKYWG